MVRLEDQPGGSHERASLQGLEEALLLRGARSDGQLRHDQGRETRQDEA